MVPFIGQGTPAWPEGVGRLHLYALPDPTVAANTAFFDLAQRHHQLLDAHFTDLVAPVEPKWLHATVQMVTAPAAAPLPEAVRADLVDALHQELAGLEEFVVWAAPHVGRFGPGLDLAPDEGFGHLIAATGAALDSVLGERRSSYRTGPPHITTGYAHTAGDSGPLASRLRASRPTRAPLTITELVLVDVTQDPHRHTYRWDEPLDRFPLTSPNQPRGA